MSTDKSPTTGVADPRQRAFLAAFRETGNVKLACKAAKVARSTHYRWLDVDPSYRTAFEQANEDAADVLEAEAWRRAVEGVEEPVGWYRGQPGGTVRKHSDTLLIFLLKGLRPEKYRERMDMRGTTTNIRVELLPDEALTRIAAGEHPYVVITDMLERRLMTPAAVREALQLPSGEALGGADGQPDTPHGKDGSVVQPSPRGSDARARHDGE